MNEYNLRSFQTEKLQLCCSMVSFILAVYPVASPKIVNHCFQLYEIKSAQSRALQLSSAIVLSLSVPN